MKLTLTQQFHSELDQVRGSAPGGGVPAGPRGRTGGRMHTGSQAAGTHWGPCWPACLPDARVRGLIGPENRTVAAWTSPEEGASSATALMFMETQASGPLECGWPPRVLWSGHLAHRISISWVRSRAKAPHAALSPVYTRGGCARAVGRP